MAHVRPVILYDGTLGEHYYAGLERAMWHADYRFFARELGGRYFRFEGMCTAIPAPVEQWKAARANMWSAALEWCHSHGLPTWQYGEVLAIFLQGVPHDYPGLGGAGAGGSPSYTGAVVKDGDALNSFTRGWTIGIHDPQFLESTGMLAHELGHAFGANRHEDPWGEIANYEWEWWEYPRCVILNRNRRILRRSIFFGGSG